MPHVRRHLLAAIVAAGTLVAPVLHAEAEDSPRYVAGGTAVVRDGGATLVDSGGMSCENATGNGGGGLCLPFGDGEPAVALHDDVNGEEVAFQVCIDNDGDGVCVSPDTSSPCPDQVFFSHNGAGEFFNPVGPLPTGFLDGCPGGPWRGYVVFVCEGVHRAPDGSTHEHPATSGTGTVTTGGEGNGDFCGGTAPQPTRKPYVLAPVADPLAPLKDPVLAPFVDPIVCPVLAALTPGALVVGVDDDGDVYAGGTREYDCPPYAD